MRIGFEAKRATHNFRGLGNYSRGLIEGLIQYAPNEKLILFHPPVKNNLGKSWLASLPASVETCQPSGLIDNLFPGYWRSFNIKNKLSSEKLDLFHGLSHEIPFGIKSLPFKKVVTIHDLIFLRYPHFFPLLDRLVYLQKFKYACNNSDMIIAICEQTKKDVMEFFGVNESKIHVHYQSCSPLFYNQVKASDPQVYQFKRPYILNVGAFEPRKNQLVLLEAYASIAHLIEEDLIFIGQGKTYKELVKNKISELNLQNRVFIYSDVKHTELPTFYQNARVFCFPSLFEGFGIPIIEALFSRTPVITSHGSCFPESAGPNSFYIDPLSKSSIANGLVSVLSDSELRNSMIINGLKYSERFHLKNSTEKLIELYSLVTAN